MSTRIVVTGGSGFLGTLLARRLLSEPVALGGAAPAAVGELTLVDLGMRTNVDGLRAVLEYARRHAVPPVFVFTSSIAVFGSDPVVGPRWRWRWTASPGNPRATSSMGMWTRPSNGS